MSKHVSIKEWACPCCGKSEADNSILNFLEDLRRFTRLPILISSGGGYRCEEYQKAHHGSKNSAHTLGKAADLRCADSIKRFKYLETATMLGIERMGVYDKHIHFDVAKEAEGFPAKVAWVGISQ